MRPNPVLLIGWGPKFRQHHDRIFGHQLNQCWPMLANYSLAFAWEQFPGKYWKMSLNASNICLSDMPINLNIPFGHNHSTRPISQLWIIGIDWSELFFMLRWNWIIINHSSLQEPRHRWNIKLETLAWLFNSILQFIRFQKAPKTKKTIVTVPVYKDNKYLSMER